METESKRIEADRARVNCIATMKRVAVRRQGATQQASRPVPL